MKSMSPRSPDGQPEVHTERKTERQVSLTEWRWSITWVSVWEASLLAWSVLPEQLGERHGGSAGDWGMAFRADRPGNLEANDPSRSKNRKKIRERERQSDRAGTARQS
jgi:hypothetical protein